MNHYSINIRGMHCNGCVGLITMSLEEAGIRSTVVSLETNSATFVSELSQAELLNLLDKLFSQLPGYYYSLLKLV